MSRFRGQLTLHVSNACRWRETIPPTCDYMGFPCLQEGFVGLSQYHIIFGLYSASPPFPVPVLLPKPTHAPCVKRGYIEGYLSVPSFDDLGFSLNVGRLLDLPHYPVWCPLNLPPPCPTPLLLPKPSHALMSPTPTNRGTYSCSYRSSSVFSCCRKACLLCHSIMLGSPVNLPTSSRFLSPESSSIPQKPIKAGTACLPASGDWGFTICRKA